MGNDRDVQAYKAAVKGVLRVAMGMRNRAGAERHQPDGVQRRWNSLDDLAKIRQPLQPDGGHEVGRARAAGLGTSRVAAGAA